MRRIITLFICLILIFSLVGCEKNVTWNGKTEVLARLSMVEDISDMRKYVGMVDYVFVGATEEIIDDTLPSRIKGHEDYYSTYKIHVVQNLKGTLVDEVVASKMGGLNKDGTMCLVIAETPSGITIADKELPIINKQYVFMAYAQEDGRLVLSEILDNRACTEEIVAEYVDYIENEVIFNRERFVSLYDANN